MRVKQHSLELNELFDWLTLQLSSALIHLIFELPINFMLQL